MKKLVACLGFFMVFVFILSSCSIDPVEEVSLEVKSDVYFIKKRVNQVIRFAPVFNVYGNKSIRSASVKTPVNETIELEAIPNELYTFSKFPSDVEFSLQIPSDGEYRFTVSDSEGQEVEDTDQMAYKNISLPVIRSAGYNEDLLAVVVKWDSVNMAEAYLVKLMDDDDNVYFNGPLMSSSVNEYSFGDFTNGWYIAPYVGFVYTIQLQAIVFDDEATDMNYYYNIREVAISEKTIIWGK